MESLFGFITLFALLLFASTIDARKAPDAYWSEVMKDQPMPDAISRLIGETPKGRTKTDCHAKDKKSFTGDFEPVPNVSSYHDKKGFADDFEPVPNLTSYHDKKGFTNDFEPVPNVTSYHDDANASTSEEKAFDKDFEPIPNVSVYRGDAVFKEDK